MRHACVYLMLLFGVAVTGAVSAVQEDEKDLQLVIQRADGTHVAAQFPLSETDLHRATHMWAWTNRSPPRKLDIKKPALTPKQIVAALGGASVRSLDVRVRGWSRPEELEFVRVIAAPVEMWQSVPESLLPVFSVSKEGRVTIAVRDPLRLRVVGKESGTVWEQVGRSTKSVDLMLRRPAVDAELKLESSDGTSVPRAFATVMNTRRGDATLILQAEFASDDHGLLRIPALPEAEVLTLVVIAEGAAPQSLSGTATELSRTIRLAPEGKVRGKFVDERNNPLEGVHVEIEGWISASAPATSRNDASSDEGGYWVVRNLPRVDVIVRASSKGRSTFRKKVTLEEGDVDLGTIPLLLSPDIALTVSDTDDRPLTGVNVTSDGGFRGKTNDHGSVMLSGLSTDEPTAVTVTAKGFVKSIVHLAPPFPKEERVVLDRAFSITGNLIDEARTPVADATAIITIGTKYRRLPVDPDGAFSFEVEVGKEFELAFESPSAAAVTRTEVAGRAGEVRNLGSIRLPTGLSVVGRIVDSTEAPIAGVRVWAVRSSAGGTVAAWVAGRVVQATSDSYGKFDLRGLAPGPALLRFDADDFARAYRNVVVESLPQDLGTVTITHGSTVTVKARSDDTAIARLDLRGEWLDADMVSAPMVGGKASLRNVPSGQYKVTVVDGQAVICERSVEVIEGAGASVECPPRMMVRGRVFLDGTPAYAGTLTWLRPSQTDALINDRLSPFGALQQRIYGVSGGTVVVRLRSDGTFETDELLPGDWQVAWRSSDSVGTPDRSITIPDAAEAQIIVEFSGGVVRGRVLDARNQPVAAARIREIQGPLFAIAAPDGAFTMTGVSAGVHRLQAALGARASRVVEVTVEAGKQTPEVTFEIDEIDRNVLSVRVIGKDGEPKPNAFVFVEAMGGIVKTLTADEKGIATAPFPEGLSDGARIVAFADNTWAFGQLRRSGDEDNLQNATIRFVSTGALKIQSEKLSGAPAILSSKAGDLSWLLARIGLFLSVSPDLPVVVHGLPPGGYEIRLGSNRVAAAVTAGSTTTVDLR